VQYHCRHTQFLQGMPGVLVWAFGEGAGEGRQNAGEITKRKETGSFWKVEKA
jgi:hypothetical protein